MPPTTTTPPRRARRCAPPTGSARADKNGFMYRSWMKNQGIPDHEFDGKPIIGICNTWSELTPCNAHFRKIAEHVKRGVFEAGGFPVEFPVFSNGESNLRPTAMLTRNLASMDVEEAIRGNPIDARGAADRLRQDHAGAADGRGELRRAGDRRHRRADAQRQARRPATSAPAPPSGSCTSRSRPATITLHEFLVGRRPACRARPAPATPWAPPRPWPAWPRRWALRCRTTRRFRRSMRGAMCWRRCRACAPSRWRAKT